jgi:hypothetical protein
MDYYSREIRGRVITNRDIIEIFRSDLPTGKRIAVRQIHRVVVANWKLTSEDWAPHPSEVERGSSYPAWKRKVQAVLHTLKLEQKLEHFPDTHEYIFDSSSFS